jgi:hypothetical protein
MWEDGEIKKKKGPKKRGGQSQVKITELTEMARKDYKDL